MARVAILLMLVISACAVSGVLGFLIGHDQGYALGQRMAKIDAMFKENRCNLRHNGERVN